MDLKANLKFQNWRSRDTVNVYIDKNQFPRLEKVSIVESTGTEIVIMLDDLTRIRLNGLVYELVREEDAA